MAELHITLSDGRTVRQPLGEGAAVIGRDLTCEIPIDDASTSRRHARFTRTPHGYTVEDLGSKNGTLVNNAPCTGAPLKDGDQILLGSALAVFSDKNARRESSIAIADDTKTESHATRYVSRDKRLVLSQRRLQMLYDLGGRLTTLQGRDALLEAAMDICFDMLHFERGAMGLRQRHGRGVDWPVVRNLRGAEGELTISRSLLSRALEHGERAIFTESSAAHSDPTVSIVQHGIRSAMCVPLFHGTDILGVIYADRTTTSTQYTEEDIDFFAAIAQQVSIGLINTRLMEDQQQMIRLNHDIEIARKIQNGLFPKKLPDRTGLKIAALNDPGQMVSGDYYDVIERDDGRVWLLMADVTGEGVGPALLMANLQAVVRVTIPQADDPGALLARWNTLICQNTEGSKFITCSLVLVDPVKRRLRLATAGHSAPLVLRASSVQPVAHATEGTFPLGIEPSAEFPNAEADMGQEPFGVFLCTDGVVEAMNAENDQFGMDRLITVLAERPDLTPAALVKHVRKAVAAFAGGARQSDDITMLALRVD